MESPLEVSSYLIPKDVNLKDAFAFVCGDSMLREMHNKRQVHLDDLHSIYMSDGNEGVEDNVCRNTATAEIRRGKQK